MFEALIQMAALVLCGVVWRYAKPGGLDAGHTRTALTGLVYYLLLPALVLLVLWRAPLGTDSFKIALVAGVSLLASLLLMYWLCHLCGMDRPTRGAAMLAAAFPNATYLGLPVLEATLGRESRSLAIQFDLFACTPLLLTVGVWIAIRYSQRDQQNLNLQDLLKVPALWAALLAVILNLSSLPMPAGFKTWLQTLASGVVPLMLISLGLSLYISRAHLKQMQSIFPVIGVKLFVMPAIAMLLTVPLGMSGMLKQAVILEAAMPSMVIGLMLCDRYGLNSVVYAAAVTVSTAISFVTLGLWFGLVQA
jgi:predicted permease